MSLSTLAVLSSFSPLEGYCLVVSDDAALFSGDAGSSFEEVIPNVRDTRRLSPLKLSGLE